MSKSQNVVTLTDDNFQVEVLDQDGVVLVDFMATWCGPCKALAPIIDELADDTSVKATIAKLDIDDAPETAKKYGIRGVPTVALFKNGEEASRTSGVNAKSSYVESINTLIGVGDATACKK